MPDFAVEVISKDDHPSEVHGKARMWLDEGVGEVWVIHPTGTTLTVFAAGVPQRTLHGDERVEGSGPLAGFWSTVSALCGH